MLRARAYLLFYDRCDVAADATREPLPVGARVVVGGVISRPEVNGKQGRVVSSDEGRGRYGVQLDSDGKQLSLRRECLNCVSGP